MSEKITVSNAIEIAVIASTLIQKALEVYNSKEPMSIEEELQRLEAARLRPSKDIIAEADAATKIP